MEWNQLQKIFDEGASKVINWLNNEYATLRSGRVNLNIFDRVKVLAYGEEMPLNQVANLQLASATQVIVKPYDRSQIKDIAKGISEANLNVNPQVSADSIRIIFPAPTEESRKINVKRAKEMLEEAKAKIRNVRKDVQGKYKNLKDVSEDLIRYFEDELNKITKKYNNTLEGIYSSKEKELMSM
ncbi:MAG: ribosome recycling factor [Mycoplasmataceae bacterium]|nr:ribosome recycling factor [Mycoplasmataceae bacterium]